MPTDDVSALACNAGSAMAAAGCGKTELIVRAASVADGRQLILTHTHAGVRAVRDRIHRLGVSSSKVSVDTIAGFALELSASYPKRSGLAQSDLDSQNYRAIYEACGRLLHVPFVGTILKSTFSGAFVDEYQDCSLRQHDLVVALSGLMPVRVVGDPLQGILNFDKGDPLVDWDVHVLQAFPQLCEPTTPHRWAASRPELGRWLQEVVRPALLMGTSVDLSTAPNSVHFVASTDMQDQIACARRAASNHGSVVCISDARAPQRAHAFAARLGGQFTSTEENEQRALLDACRRIDATSGRERLLEVLSVAGDCFTRFRSELGTVEDRFRSGATPRPRDAGRARLVSALVDVEQVDSLKPVGAAFEAFRYVDGIKPCRRDLLAGMRIAAALAAAGGVSMTEAGEAHRDMARRYGRRHAALTVSRTPLIKGLEFEAAVVLDVRSHDAANLYVAMTRASHDLYVLAPSNVVQASAS